MTDSPKKLLYAALRNDLVAFIQYCFQVVDPGTAFLPNWHIESIAHELEKVIRGETTRLILNIPPRNLKSICASVALPAFLLGLDPTRRILCVSYSIELAAKHSRDCRAVMEHPVYKSLFSKTRLSRAKNTELEFTTTAGGSRLATSVGGTLTGRGANLIIIDDPQKPEEALSEARRMATNGWFDTTLSTRLDQKTRDSIILVMQRLHQDDLTGHVLARDPTGWHVLTLSAIADERTEIDLGHGVIHVREVGDVLHPEREPQAILDQIKNQQSSLTFSAQYQQAPVPPEGALIKREWFRYYDQPPIFQTGDKIVQSWDIASKIGPQNDYTVCLTVLMRRTDYYILHGLRERLEYPDLQRKAIQLRDHHKAKTVLIEEAGTGIPLIQDLKRNGGFRPIEIKPEKEKIVRVDAVTDLLEAGHVLLPRSAPWLADFLAEVLAFPNGRHDDQVDALSQFLAWAKLRKGTVHVSFYNP